MTRGHAIELLFDAESERRIVDVWGDIRGRTGIEAAGGRPHLSLAVMRPPGDPDVLGACVDEFARRVEPMRFRLSAVGAFPGDTGVVFLAPTVGRELSVGHSVLHEILRDHSVVTDELYQPGRWVPHCTMALHVPPHDVPGVVEVVRESAAFGPVSTDRVGLVEFMPVRELAERRLGNLRF